MCRKLTWLVSLVLLLGLGHSASAATNPYPPDGTIDVSTDVILSWDPEYGAVSYDVYFGTSSPPPWIGKQAPSNYDPGTLEPGTTYFWRVNEFTAMGTNSRSGLELYDQEHPRRSQESLSSRWRYRCIHRYSP